MATTYVTSISYFSGTDVVKNVVAGQALYITISVKATGGDVPVGTTVTLANVKGGITFVGEQTKKLQPGNDKTVATTVALLQIPDNAATGTPVSFNLALSNGVAPPAADITYTVKAIVLQSLALMLDNELLQMPTVDNLPGTGTINSTYSTVLLSATNTPLPNVQVAITAVLPASLGDFTFSTNANTPVTLPIVSIDDTRQYFVVTSDTQGKISFRAYPIINKTGVMVLTSTFFGSPVPIQQALSPLIVVDLNKKMNPLDILSPPSILEIQNGVLTAANNAVACHALIPTYHNSSVGDYIVPLVNGKYTHGSLVQITDAKELNTYFMSLPFNLFTVSMDGSLENSFSYAIASTSGNVTNSYPMGFVYKGGAGNKPANIPRPFEIGTVYSSHDNGTGKPEDKIIVNAVVNNNDVYQPNADHAALYFAINGVRNNNNNKNPVFGQKIGVRVYILSVNKSLITDVTDITPGATLGNKYFTMPTAAANIDTARLFVKIPLTIVGGVRADPDTGGPGSIYIEYYTYDGNPQVYGVYWQGFINTVNPGQ
jgi:hypothetical protein